MTLPRCQARPDETGSLRSGDAAPGVFTRTPSYPGFKNAVRLWLPLVGGIAYLAAGLTVVFKLNRPGAFSAPVILMSMGITMPSSRKHWSKDGWGIVLVVPLLCVCALVAVLLL